MPVPIVPLPGWGPPPVGPPAPAPAPPINLPPDVIEAILQQAIAQGKVVPVGAQATETPEQKIQQGANILISVAQDFAKDPNSPSLTKLPDGLRPIMEGVHQLFVQRQHPYLNRPLAAFRPQREGIVPSIRELTSLKTDFAAAAFNFDLNQEVAGTTGDETQTLLDTQQVLVDALSGVGRQLGPRMDVLWDMISAGWTALQPAMASGKIPEDAYKAMAKYIRERYDKGQQSRLDNQNRDAKQLGKLETQASESQRQQLLNDLMNPDLLSKLFTPSQQPGAATPPPAAPAPATPADHTGHTGHTGTGTVGVPVKKGPSGAG